jgi:hypothetical protein
MLNGEIRSRIDALWNAFWTGGISNPLEVIEQITYLLFLKRLDDLHTLEENKAARLKLKKLERRVLPVVWVEDLFRGDSIDTNDSRRVIPAGSEVDKYGLKTGDILFCRSSLKLDGIAFNNVYLGKDDATLFECHLIRISPDLKIVSPVFLNCLLRLPQVRAIAKSKSKTATMTTIDQQSLCSIELPLPPIELQREFASRVAVKAPVDPVDYISGKGTGEAPRSGAVQQFLREVQAAADEVEEAGEDTGRVLTIFKVKLESTKKIEKADVLVGVTKPGEAFGPLTVVKTVDPNFSHPHRQMDIIKQVGSMRGISFTSHVFTAVAWKFDLKSKPQYCWKATGGVLTKYAPETIPWFQRLSESDIKGALKDYREHLRTQRNVNAKKPNE